MSKDNQPPVSEENLKYKVFLFDDVLREELNLVSARRKVLFPRIVKRDRSPIAETAPRRLSAAWAPDTDEPAKGEKDSDKAVTVQREIALDAHLAGLAFSGGGIRSASFAIGVLQGLASLKLFNWFDYLSTVSGGGYAGGWLAAWLYREGSPINVESQLDTSRIRQSKADRHFEKKPAAEEKNRLPKRRSRLPKRRSRLPIGPNGRSSPRSSCWTRSQSQSRTCGLTPAT